jgi:hypothetical protein
MRSDYNVCGERFATRYLGTSQCIFAFLSLPLGRFPHCYRAISVHDNTLIARHDQWLAESDAKG